MGNGKLRVFFAISIPFEVKRNLIQIQDALKTELKQIPIKWVESENIHLTLKFLGDTENKTIPQIISLLEQNINPIQAFDLSLTSLGAYPTLAKARILWVGCNYPNQLPMLVRCIEDVSYQFRFKRETQPYSAHITLGRIKSFSAQTSQPKLEDILKKDSENLHGQWKVNQFQLLSSDLQPHGPVYKSIHTFNLQSNV